jgi:DNA-binding NarL/FixJ family response regulator
MENIRVLIIDDHPLFRQGICWSLSLEKDIQVIGQAENGTEAIKLTETLNPHVVLLDINLPGLNGLEVARVLKRRSPRMGIIVLSIHDDDEQLFN